MKLILLLAISLSSFAYADDFCRSLLSVAITNPATNLRGTLQSIPDHPVGGDALSILSLSINYAAGRTSPRELIERYASEFGVSIPEDLVTEHLSLRGNALHLVAMAPPRALKTLVGRLELDERLVADATGALVVSASSVRLPDLRSGDRLISMDERNLSDAIERLNNEAPNEVRLVNLPSAGFFFARVPADRLAVYADALARKMPASKKDFERVNINSFLEPASRPSSTPTTFDRFKDLLTPVVGNRSRLILVSQNQERFALISLADLALFQRLRETSEQNFAFPHRVVSPAFLKRILACADCGPVEKNAVAPVPAPVPAPSPEPASRPKSSPRPAAPTSPANAAPIERRELRTSQVYAKYNALATPGDPFEISLAKPVATIMRSGAPYVLVVSVPAIKTLAADQLDELLERAAGESVPNYVREQLRAYRDGKATHHVRLPQLASATGPGLLQRDDITIVTNREQTDDLFALVPVTYED